VALLLEHKTRVREIAAEFSQDHPSTEPIDLAEAVGVRLEYGDLGDKDGAYDPQRNVIFLSKKASPERQRFTMAHEVTHFLILADDDLLSDLHDAYSGDALEENIEVLCNVGASEILVPSTELEKLLKRYGRSARAIPKITQSFGVSRPAACVALASHLEEPGIVCVMRSKGKPGARHLEVEFSAKSDGMKYGLGTGTHMPSDHPCVTALETGLPLEERSYIPFRSGKKMPALVDAHPEGSIVYALFTPEATAEKDNQVEQTTATTE
jgi:Zn-dependent peptidase ImmA (M78 family)